MTFDQESLLVVSQEGTLLRLRVPFRVQLISKVPELELLEYYQVQCVKQDSQEIMVYFIKGNAYYYFNFNILL